MNKINGKRLEFGNKEQIEELGRRLRSKAISKVRHDVDDVECPYCNGTGEVEEIYHRCPKCKEEKFYFDDQFIIEDQRVLCRSCNKEIKVL